MRELWSTILEALISALPITAIVYVVALLPWFDFSVATLIGLCVGVGSAIALAVVRIIFDFSLAWYIVPGYFISLALSLVVPPMYTAVAFDSGGVAKEDAAAFFGITIHAEKEILMMAVEREQRDAILNALYKEMGMGKKAQGIAFSLPVSDVAGLVKEPEEKHE